MAGINLPSFPTTGSDVSDLAPWDPIENVISGKPSHTIYVASEDPGIVSRQGGVIPVSA